MPEKAIENSSQERFVYLVPQAAPGSGVVEQPFDVRALWETLWSGRWTVILITVFFVISGGAYAFLATSWYQAEVVLSPVSAKSLPGGLAQLGGLASLAGIDIPGAGSGEPIAVLKSKGFLRDFIKDEQLLPLLLADSQSTTFSSWQLAASNEPDIRDAVKYFDEKLRSVTEDKKSGMVTLAVKWKKPDVAAQWANLLVKRLNERLRAQAIAESRSSIDYLQKEMLATTVISLQQSIGRVLEGQMQKMALARASDEFAFKVVDIATAPKQRKSPRRAILLLISAIVGGGLGVLWVLGRDAFKKP